MLWRAVLCCVPPLRLQELVGIMAASKGLVLMAPPGGNAEAKKTMAGMLSAIKPNTKVGGGLTPLFCFLGAGRRRQGPAVCVCACAFDC